MVSTLYSWYSYNYSSFILSPKKHSVLKIPPLYNDHQLGDKSDDTATIFSASMQHTQNCEPRLASGISHSLMKKGPCMCSASYIRLKQEVGRHLRQWQNGTNSARSTSWPKHLVSHNNNIKSIHKREGKRVSHCAIGAHSETLFSKYKVYNHVMLRNHLPAKCQRNHQRLRSPPHAVAISTKHQLGKHG